METTRVGNVTVTRLLMGSNPFSGFSHQSTDRDREMVHYFTTAKIKEILFDAERLGITGIVARTDHHVMRVLLEYRDDGGKMSWLAQTCPGVGPTSMCVGRAVEGGAKACHIHGGVMDNLVATGQFDEIKRGVDEIKSYGLPAGIAGHNVRVFEWAEKNVEADYYMCCHYNPTIRDERPEHVHGAEEKFRDEDRQAMVALARTLRKPVIHYKIFAAGRNKAEDAFAFCGKIMRPEDMACIGVFPKDDPAMVRKDVALFEKYCGLKK
jgi:hypothetical protein